jgi:hypothetical protein
MKPVRRHYQGFVLTGYNNSWAVSSGIITDVLAKAIQIYGKIYQRKEPSVFVYMTLGKEALFS